MSTDLLTTEPLVELHRRMLLVRRFEERVAVLYRDGDVPGFVHISIGQEATAVGVCSLLGDADGVVSNHRGHGHCIAKGVDLEAMFAELMGRTTGACRGMGGSMHIADVSKGIFGANGIVGAGLPIAGGVALGFRLLGSHGVVAAFFGDGAIAQGAFHEAVNLAALWKLPVLFVCENNGYAEMTPFAAQHPVPVTERGKAYGIDTLELDGNDVVGVVQSLAPVVDAMRVGHTGPMLVEARTYRHRGHYEGDPERYRTVDERTEWMARDPIARIEELLVSRGATQEMLDRTHAAVTATVAQAEEAARSGPVAGIDVARDALFAPRPRVDEPAPVEGPPEYRQMDAVHDALEHALQDDDRVWLLGIDVGEAGNIFGLTRGLIEAFPGRVRDTPISETALVGAAVGAAMAGTRPVVEIMYLDFIGVCFDQLLNQAAKLRFMTGGGATLPLVVRTQFGAGRSSGAQHSQSLEALLAHIPGLTVVMPSTPEDAYGLLRTAIEDDNPVVVIEHRLLYGKKGARVPRDHRVPIGRGVVRREGTTATVVSWSRMVRLVLEAAEQLAPEGIDLEVIDLRTLAPLDVELVERSVRRTGRLAVAHEAVLTGGLGGEIAAMVADRCFWDLDAPVERIATEFLPAPYSPVAEAAWLVDVGRVTESLRRLARA